MGAATARQGRRDVIKADDHSPVIHCEVGHHMIAIHNSRVHFDRKLLFK